MVHNRVQRVRFRALLDELSCTGHRNKFRFSQSRRWSNWRKLMSEFNDASQSDEAILVFDIADEAIEAAQARSGKKARR